MKKVLSIIIFFLQVTFAQNPPQWIIYNTSNSLLPSNDIDHIVIDNINRKWISFPGFGLLKIDNEDWTLYNISNSNIPSDFLISINVDENLNLWAGGYNSNFQLTKFDGFSWTTWNSTNSPIPEDYVMSLIFDNQNDLWLLCMSDPPSGSNYVLELTQDSVWNFHASFTTFIGYRQMLFDEHQILWVGVWNGLYKYDGDSLIFINNQLGQYITDIKKDLSGNIWIAAGLAGWGGLVKYDGILFTGYNIEATSIELDSIGNLWIGTEALLNPSAELIKYDGNNWITYNSSNSSLPSTYRITDLTFDKFGNLWIGTSDSGLVVFNEDGIIIPVELSSFTTSVINNNVELNWSTETETNNQGFEIERREGNRELEVGDWEKIGYVAGFGTTTEPKSYSFTDKNLPTGKYSYRLKQIDFDGTFEYSQVIEAEVIALSEFALEQNYPNPFNPTINIEFRIANFGFVSLKVYDILGREVAVLVNEVKPAGEYEVEFNAGDLSSGIYLYRITSGNFIETKKLMFMK